MLLHVDPDKRFRRVHVCPGHFCEHDLNVVGGHTDLPVGLREDSMWTTKADVGLEDIVDDRLIDAQTVGQGVNQLRP